MPYVDINVTMSTLPLFVVHEVRDTCLCLATQRAARVLARRFDRVFQLLGLTNGQFSLMMALNAPATPSMSDLAEFLAMDRTTLTAALKSLQTRELVTVKPDAKDRRVRRLQLTDKGRQLMLSALPIWRQEHAHLERDIDGVSVPRTRQALAAIAACGPKHSVALPTRSSANSRPTKQKRTKRARRVAK